MKNYLSLTIFIIFDTILNCTGQERVQTLTTLGYTVDGVIFPSSQRLMFKLKKDATLFTPNKDQVGKAEDYLLNHRADVKYKYMTGWFEPKTLAKKLRGHKRQYIGYLLNGDSAIFIQTLNFKNRREAKESFEGWEKQVIVSFGSFAEKATIRFEINLTKKTVGFY